MVDTAQLLYAGIIDDAKALNITSNHATYDTNVYMIVSLFNNRIIHVLIVEGYNTNSALVALPAENIVKIYEDTTYPINGISGIMSSKDIRVKISMSKTLKGYQSFILPLRNGNKAEYTAYWATS